MKERDMDKTITGFLFHPYFLYGLLQLLCFVACVVGAVLIFLHEEKLFLRIFGAVLLLFCSGAGLTSGIKHVREAWTDWRDYVNEGKENA